MKHENQLSTQTTVLPPNVVLFNLHEQNVSFLFPLKLKRLKAEQKI